MAFPNCCRFLNLYVLLVTLFLVTVRAGKQRTKFLPIKGKILVGNHVPQRPNYHPHPFVVSIQYKHTGFQHTCGGSILDQWTIITAAHCFEEQSPTCMTDPSCYRIVAGIYDQSVRGSESEQIQEFAASDIDVHENYDGFHYDNDIALVHLKNPLVYSSYVKPIRLVNPDREYRKTNATIVGWGKYDTNMIEMSQALQEAKVNIFSDHRCLHQWGDDYHSEIMMCAAGATFSDETHLVADACEGDSGGPLVARDITRKRRYLVGLISWGYDCGIKEYPGVYTRVQSFLEWIESKRASMKSKRHERSVSNPCGLFSNEELEDAQSTSNED